MTIQVTKDMQQEKYLWKPIGGDNPRGVQVPGRRRFFDWLVGRSEELSDAKTGQAHVQISFQGVSGSFNGVPLDSSGYKSLKWTDSETPRLYSYIAYVVHRLDGSVVATYAHAGPSGRTFHDDSDQDPGSTEVPKKLGDYAGNQKYILIFLWASVIDEYISYDSDLLAPSGPFMEFLHSCGAGPGWHSQIHTDHYDLKGPGPYALVGVIGSGTGGGFEKWIDVSIQKSPLNEVPEDASVSLTVGLKYIDGQGWTPTAF